MNRLPIATRIRVYAVPLTGFMLILRTVSLSQLVAETVRGNNTALALAQSNGSEVEIRAAESKPGTDRAVRLWQEFFKARGIDARISRKQEPS
jgi:hypothetical protein